MLLDALVPFYQPQQALSRPSPSFCAGKSKAFELAVVIPEMQEGCQLFPCK